jgi:hypothetical protein
MYNMGLGSNPVRVENYKGKTVTRELFLRVKGVQLESTETRKGR